MAVEMILPRKGIAGGLPPVRLEVSVGRKGAAPIIDRRFPVCPAVAAACIPGRLQRLFVRINRGDR